MINNQAETAAVLTQKEHPAEANKHKIKGDVNQGLMDSTFGVSAEGLARLRQHHRDQRAIGGPGSTWSTSRAAAA